MLEIILPGNPIQTFITERSQVIFLPRQIGLLKRENSIVVGLGLIPGQREHIKQKQQNALLAALGAKSIFLFCKLDTVWYSCAM